MGNTFSGKHSCGPFPHDAPPQPANYFKASSTGILLHYRSWSPSVSPPRAMVYVVHGYGEHLGRHEPFARTLAAAGFAVHALDLQGHGQSHGDRAFLTSMNDVVSDVLELATRVAPTPCGVPAFIFGHSMGGLIALRAAQSAVGAAMFRGAVLSAPAVMIDPKIDTAFNRWLALTFSDYLPKLPVTPLEPNLLCTDKSVVDAYMRDPLVYHGNIRVRTGAEIIKGCDAAFADAPAMTVPLLIIHGGSDKVCPVQGSRRLAALLPPPRAELQEWPESFHELLNEPVFAAAAIDRIIRWIGGRIAAVTVTVSADAGEASPHV
jgi:alpha-beta hydrolase superfamily lysophospholipase